MLLAHGDVRRTNAHINLQTELVIRDSTGVVGPDPHCPADPGDAIASAPEAVASYAKE
jgi:LacI family transcriptional regulator